MNDLRQKAKELLGSGKVKLIIGYEEGPGNKVRAAFSESEESAGKLIFDSRCVQNLAVYLTRKDIRDKGKIAITASVAVMYSIIQLASENQLSDEYLTVLGISPDMTLTEFENMAAVEKFLTQHKVRMAERDAEMLEKISRMTADERWNFWLKTLEPCFKCYACRAACPLCYCTRCTVESNRPQWIPVPSHTIGNLEWHIMRALHMSGRCTDCEACARACPIGIPLNLLTKKIHQDMTGAFGEFSPSVSAGNMMSTFKPDDKETFIR
jgi:ferredoxin